MLSSSTRRRRPVRVNRKNKTRRANRKGSSKTHVPRSVALAVKQALRSNIETKYVASSWTDNYVLGNLSGQSAQRRLFNLIPPIGQGSESNQRVGNVIVPIKMVATVQYFFHSPGVGAGGPVGQDSSGVEAAGLYQVRQLVLKPKFARSDNAWASDNSSAQHSQILDQGTGYTTWPNSQLPENLLYPVAKSQYTPVAGCKKFIMGKNKGQINGTTAQDYPGNGVRAQNTVRFKVKLPKTLKYNQPTYGPDGTLVAREMYPQNALTVFGTYAGILAESAAVSLVTKPATNYDTLLGAQVPAGPGMYSWPHPILRYNLRVELWFKDA